MAEEARVTNKQGGQSTVIGNADPRLSDACKVWITDGSTTIVGVTGKGTTLDVSAQWNQPLQNMTPGNAAGEALQGVAQMLTGMTLVTALNTRKAWTGNEPTRFNVELLLYALKDTDKEVMQPLRALEYMIAPDVGDYFAFGGEIAKALQINFGNRIIYQHLTLDNLSVPMGGERDSQGRFVRCTVNLTMSTLTMVTKQMLKQGYGVKSDYQWQANK